METSHLKFTEKFINFLDTANIEEINDKLSKIPTLRRTEHIESYFLARRYDLIKEKTLANPNISLVSDLFYCLQNFHYEIFKTDNLIKLGFLMCVGRRFLVVEYVLDKIEYNNLFSFLKEIGVYGK